MAINNEASQIYNDDSNDDNEDNDEYYLQPTLGNYDIQEKIRAANDELFKDLENYNISREQRVTFRDELVDYEPSYSSDDGYVHSPDALSIISDEHEEIQDVPQEIIYTISEENDLEINEYNDLSPNCEILLQKSIGFFDTIEETIEANIEEIENIRNEDEILDNCDDEVEEEIFDEQYIEVVEIINDSFDDDEAEESCKKSSDSNTINSRTSIEKYEKPVKKVKTKLEQTTVDCRIHCLEKKHLDLMTGKPKNYIELLNGPVLKIRQRSCCTNQEVKPKLPVYNGFVSEYGLTKTQLEKRQLKKEKSAQRKKEKCIKIKEEKMQKDLYNEEIFSAWLQSIKNRNQIKNSDNKDYKVKEVPLIPQNKRQRPKTANIYQAYPSISKTENVYRKRPSTSPCKGYTYNIILVQNSS